MTGPIALLWRPRSVDSRRCRRAGWRARCVTEVELQTMTGRP